MGWRRGRLRQKLTAICDCDFRCSQVPSFGLLPDSWKNGSGSSVSCSWATLNLVCICSEIPLYSNTYRQTFFLRAITGRPNGITDRNLDVDLTMHCVADTDADENDIGSNFS